MLAYWNAWSESNNGTHFINLLGRNESLPIGTGLDDREAGVKVIPLQQADDLTFIDIAVILGHSKLNLLPGWLHFSGDPGRTYRLQTSSDLRIWSDLAADLTFGNEQFVRMNRDAAHAFYRVLEAPALR